MAFPADSKSFTALLVRCQQSVNRICRSSKPPSGDIMDLNQIVHQAQAASKSSPMSEQQHALTWEIAVDIWVWQ